MTSVRKEFIRAVTFHRTSRPFWRKSLLVFMAFLMLLPMEALTQVSKTAKASSPPPLNGEDCAHGPCPPPDFSSIGAPGGDLQDLLYTPGMEGEGASGNAFYTSDMGDGGGMMLMGARQTESIATTSAPIVLLRGAASETATDLYLPGPAFDWQHVRSYDSHVDQGESEEASSSSGSRWQSDTEGPYLYLAGSGDIQVKTSASTYREFKKTGTDQWSSPGDFSGSLEKVTYDTYYNDDDPEDPDYHPGPAGSSYIYVIENYDTGVILIYDDFQGTGRARLFERRHRNYPRDQYGIVYLYNGNKVAQVTTAEPQAWDIHYHYDGSGRLDWIKVFAGTVPDPEATGADDLLIMRADYTYFDSGAHTADLGSSGDLVSVTVSRKPSAGTEWITRTTMYRYYRYNSANGRSHQLKGVYEADAIQRILDYPNSAFAPASSSPGDIAAAIEDLLEADDDDIVAGSLQIKDFASRQFTYYTASVSTASITTPFQSNEPLNGRYGGSELVEYNSDANSGMVRTETVNGACGSCGGGSAPGGITHTYFYMSLNGGPGQQYPVATAVVQIVVEDTQDADGNHIYRRLYGLNHRGMALRTAFVDMDPDDKPMTADMQMWCTSTVIDTDFRVTQRRMPSAHKDVVTDSNSLKTFLNPHSGTNDHQTLSPTNGVVYRYGYDATTKNLLWTKLRYKTGPSSSTDYLVEAFEWGDGTDDPVYMLKSTSYFPTKETDPAAGIKYLHDYEYWGDPEDCQVKKVTSTTPSVGSGENGPGVEAISESYLDTYGRVRWTKDEEGYVNYYSYHPFTGNLAYVSIDVSDSFIPDAGSGKWVDVTDGDADSIQPNRGRGTTLPAALELVSTGEFDDLGRQVLVTTPSGKQHAARYFYNGVARYPFIDSGNVAQLPASVVLVDHGGNVQLKYSVPAGTADADASSLPASSSSDVSRTVYTYNTVNGQLNKLLRYHNIPSSGDGDHLDNYYITHFDYDSQGRRTTTIQSVQDTTNHKFQASQLVYDTLGRAISLMQDSLDAAINTDREYVATTPITLSYPVAAVVYDEGGVGDGHITTARRYHGTGTNDFTGVNYYRNYRGHLRMVEPFSMDGSTETPEMPQTVADTDWSGRTIAAARYVAAQSTGTVLDDEDYAATISPDRHKLVKAYFDSRGRSYRSEVFPGTESTKHFQINRHYDLRNNLVATGVLHSAHQEFAYDGAGRQYQSRTVLETPGSYSGGGYTYAVPAPHPTIANMPSGDGGVIAFTHQVFNAQGNLTENHSFEANHDNPDGIDLGSTSDYVRSTAHYWYDDLDRPTAVAGYGAGNDSSTDDFWMYTAAPGYGSEPTASSDKKLVALFGYDADTGRQNLVTDPQGVKRKTFFDDLGRKTFVAENWDDFADGTTPSGFGGGTDNDKDRVTGFTYTGLNKVKTLTAYNGSTSTQPTTYEYTDNYNAGLVTRVIYPDGDTSDDNVTFTYHFDGSRATRIDQRGAKITYHYTSRRQVEAEAVDLSSLVSGQDVDSTVMAITRKYDDLGRVEFVTSHAGPHTTGESGMGGVNSADAVNQIRYTYDPTYGLLTESEQEHNGAVDGSTPSVQYAYDDAVDGSSRFTNALRRKSTTYPNGRIIHQTYDAADSIADRLSRVAMLEEDASGSPGTDLTAYAYAGINRLATSDLKPIEVKLDLYQGTTNGTYSGYDRFGRVIDHLWDDYGSGSPPDIARVKHGYDYTRSSFKKRE